MTPGISIIIAHRNASQKLKACVESLVQSSYTPFEIIVVDDASDEDPRAALAGLPVTWLPLKTGRGSGYARHKGAEVAAYDTKIRAANKPRLFEIEMERGVIARALNGKTGAAS